MIRPLRAAHRGAFVALAVALPVLFAAALAGRHEPALQELPDELLPGATPEAFLGVEELVYWCDERPASGAIPDEAELVGTVRAGALAQAPPPGEVAVRYSVFHHRVDPGEESP